MKLTPYNFQTANSLYNEYHDNPSQTFFRGAVSQKGYGVGGILTKFFQNNIPILKKGALNLGRIALSSGLNAIKNSIEGENFKNSLTKNLKQGGLDIIKSVASDTKLLKRKRPSLKSHQPNKKKRSHKPKLTRKVNRKVKGTKDIFS